MKKTLAAAVVLTGLASVAASQQQHHRETFMPDNDLYKFDCRSCESKGITQEEYLAVIARAKSVFAPIVAAQGGKLNIVDHWDDSTVNASAIQTGDEWTVNMYGGLARRREITVDGFTFVLCHEIGHHLGGFPFMSDIFGGGARWASAEGQADYFAGHACPALVWNQDDAATTLAPAQAPATVKAQCDQVWKTQGEQNLCYRAALAGKSATDLLASLGGTTISFEEHDQSKVDSTYTGHPVAQCRLDTYVAAATCAASWNTSVIPGKESGTADNSITAEEAAAKYNCTASGQYSIGLRPACWFASRL